MEFLGINWVGINPQNGQKFVLSVIFIVVVVLLRSTFRWAAGRILNSTDISTKQTKFWVRQAISLVGAIVLILGLLSIWFNDPTRLATAFGLISAGLAFALQQPVTAIAGYFTILRGATFNVGDRISMGGVRGDVVRLGFMQTAIMEMGQPPAVQGSDPAMWVKSRQFTGRIVTVSNSKIFSEPVFNYSRDFPLIWEEISIPITYEDDRAEAERVLLEAARKHGGDPAEMALDAKAKLEKEYGVEQIDLEPTVYYRITDNWLELSVRFIVTTHRIRAVKDAMSRDILIGLEAADIGIASATYDIVGLPRVEMSRSSEADDR
jgi:small-conductance mechanosensitive channel